jgi:hypothetical protein
MPQPDLNASSVEMKVARSRLVLASEFSSNVLTGNVNLTVPSFHRCSRYRNSLKKVVGLERATFSGFGNIVSPSPIQKVWPVSVDVQKVAL